jgi:hypothetical protein
LINIFSSFILKFRAEEKRLKKLAHEQYLKEEMIKSYKKFLEQEAQSKKHEQELRKLEIIQRLNVNEANRKFYKERYEKNIKDVEETRNSYEKQIVSYVYVSESLYVAYMCIEVLTEIQVQKVLTIQKPFGMEVLQLPDENWTLKASFLHDLQF